MNLAKQRRGGSTRRRFAALLVLPLVLAACASLDGLDEGTAADAGLSHPAPDATVAHDASDGSVTDADASADSTRPIDALAAHDAHADASDAGARVDAHDAAVHPEAGDGGEEAARDAARASDARTDVSDAAACVPVAIPDAGSPPACPGPDAAACAPKSTTGFTYTWVPPAAPMSVCTTAQIKNLMDSCFGANATQAACQAIFDSAADEACNSCMLTDSTASTWGALVYYPQYGVYTLNTGGCIALTAPCQTGCATAYETAQECLINACAATCPVTGADYGACIANATECGCYAQSAAQVTCGDELVVGPPALCILNDSAAGFVAQAELYGNLFCVGPQDAGTDGSAPDAASHD